MTHNSFRYVRVKGWRLLFIAALVAGLALGIIPMHPAYANPQAVGVHNAAVSVSQSDLAISLVSAPPKHAKACDTFEATYTITNLGPDDAANVNVFINVPDQFSVINIPSVPVNLAVRESATVTAVIKVVAFVPGESRAAWVRASVGSDVYPDVSIDPNPDNNEVFSAVKLISKQVMSCQP